MIIQITLKGYKMKWFFTELFKKDGAISSKITMGVLLTFNAIAMGYVRPTAVNLIGSFLLTAGGLLGVSIASDIVKVKKGKDEK